jgi:hypothetical protein
MADDTSSDPQSVGDVLDRVRKIGEEAGEDKVRLRDLLEAMGSRAFGPVFILLPLIEISPVGGIPGLPSALAALMVFFAVQMFLARAHPWLPGFLANRGVKGRRLVTVADKTRGIGDRMDRWFHGRLPALTEGPMVRIAAVAIILLCLTVPPLELLPFASTLPMAAILVFGIALLVRDGVVMLIAAALSLAAVGVGLGWLAIQGLGTKS